MVLNKVVSASVSLCHFRNCSHRMIEPGGGGGGGVIEHEMIEPVWDDRAL